MSAPPALLDNLSIANQPVLPRGRFVLTAGQLSRLVEEAVRLAVTADSPLEIHVNMGRLSYAHVLDEALTAAANSGTVDVTLYGVADTVPRYLNGLSIVELTPGSTLSNEWFFLSANSTWHQLIAAQFPQGIMNNARVTLTANSAVIYDMASALHVPVEHRHLSAVHNILSARLLHALVDLTPDVQASAQSLDDLALPLGLAWMLRQPSRRPWDIVLRLMQQMSKAARVDLHRFDNVSYTLELMASTGAIETPRQPIQFGDVLSDAALMNRAMSQTRGGRTLTALPVPGTEPVWGVIALETAAPINEKHMAQLKIMGALAEEALNEADGKRSFALPQPTTAATADASLTATPPRAAQPPVQERQHTLRSDIHYETPDLARQAFSAPVIETEPVSGSYNEPYYEDFDDSSAQFNDDYGDFPAESDWIDGDYELIEEVDDAVYWPELEEFKRATTTMRAFERVEPEPADDDAYYAARVSNQVQKLDLNSLDAGVMDFSMPETHEPPAEKATQVSTETTPAFSSWATQVVEATTDDVPRETQAPSISETVGPERQTFPMPDSIAALFDNPAPDLNSPDAITHIELVPADWSPDAVPGGFAPAADILLDEWSPDAVPGNFAPVDEMFPADWSPDIAPGNFAPVDEMIPADWSPDTVPGNFAPIDEMIPADWSPDAIPGNFAPVDEMIPADWSPDTVPGNFAPIDEMIPADWSPDTVPGNFAPVDEMIPADWSPDAVPGNFAPIDEVIPADWSPDALATMPAEPAEPNLWESLSFDGAPAANPAPNAIEPVQFSLPTWDDLNLELSEFNLPGMASRPSPAQPAQLPEPFEPPPAVELPTWQTASSAPVNMGDVMPFNDTLLAEEEARSDDFLPPMSWGSLPTEEPAKPASSAPRSVDVEIDVDANARASFVPRSAATQETTPFNFEGLELPTNWDDFYRMTGLEAEAPAPAPSTAAPTPTPLQTSDDLADLMAEIERELSGFGSLMAMVGEPETSESADERLPIPEPVEVQETLPAFDLPEPATMPVEFTPVADVPWTDDVPETMDTEAAPPITEFAPSADDIAEGTAALTESAEDAGESLQLSLAEETPIEDETAEVRVEDLDFEDTQEETQPAEVMPDLELIEDDAEAETEFAEIFTLENIEPEYNTSTSEETQPVSTQAELVEALEADDEPAPAAEIVVPATTASEPTAPIAMQGATWATSPAFSFGDLRTFMARLRERINRVMPATSGRTTAQNQMMNQVIKETDLTIDILDDLSFVVDAEGKPLARLDLTTLINDIINSMNKGFGSDPLRIHVLGLARNVGLLGHAGAAERGLRALFEGAMKLLASGSAEVELTMHTSQAVLKLQLYPVNIDQAALDRALRYFEGGIPRHGKLALAAMIIHQHGGSIEATAQPGQSLVEIVITLPAVDLAVEGR